MELDDETLELLGGDPEGWFGRIDLSKRERTDDERRASNLRAKLKALQNPEEARRKWAENYRHYAKCNPEKISAIQARSYAKRMADPKKRELRRAQERSYFVRRQLKKHAPDWKPRPRVKMTVEERNALARARYAKRMLDPVFAANKTKRQLAYMKRKRAHGNPRAPKT